MVTSVTQHLFPSDNRVIASQAFRDGLNRFGNENRSVACSLLRELRGILSEMESFAPLFQAPKVVKDPGKPARVEVTLQPFRELTVLLPQMTAWIGKNCFFPGWENEKDFREMTAPLVRAILLVLLEEHKEILAASEEHKLQMAKLGREVKNLAQEIILTKNIEFIFGAGTKSRPLTREVLHGLLAMCVANLPYGLAQDRLVNQAPPAPLPLNYLMYLEPTKIPPIPRGKWQVPCLLFVQAWVAIHVAGGSISYSEKSIGTPEAPADRFTATIHLDGASYPAWDVDIQH